MGLSNDFSSTFLLEAWMHSTRFSSSFFHRLFDASMS